MIKNFSVINSTQEIKKWSFDKFYPYTYQIRDIVLRTITALENQTPQQFEQSVKNTNEEVKKFCESKGFPKHLPSAILCENLMEKLEAKIRLRKKVTAAKIIAPIILQKLDMAIDLLKEKDLKSSSKIIQQSESLLQLVLKNRLAGLNAEDKNKKSNAKSLEVKNKVFDILARHFMDDNGLPKWVRNKSNTAKLIYERREANHMIPECLTKEDIQNIGKKNELAVRGKKTIEDYIDEFFH